MDETNTPKVNKWNNEIDGELCESSMEQKLDRLGYTFNKHSFPPGTDFPDHSHDTAKLASTVCGQFRISVCGQTFILEPGDMVEVPEKAVHSAGVVGSEEVVMYDAERKK